MGSAKWFHSEMVSAPQLTSTSGSLITLLDACLVDGFDGRDSLGWSKVFQNTANTIAVYRAPEGTRGFWQITDDGSGTSGFKTARVRWYQSMSDFETGSLYVPTTDYAFIVKNVGTSWPSGTTWQIFGDSKGFWFINVPGSYSPTTWYSQSNYPKYFGDYIPLNMEDNWNSCMFADYNVNGTQFFLVSPYLSYTSSMNNEYGKYCCYNHGGTTTNYRPCTLMNPKRMNMYSTNAMGGTIRDSTYTNFEGPMNGAVMMNAPLVKCNQLVARGYLPGLYIPQVRRAHWDTASYNKKIIVDGKKEFHIIMICPAPTQGSSGNTDYDQITYIAIDAGEGFRP